MCVCVCVFMLHGHNDFAHLARLDCNHLISGGNLSTAKVRDVLWTTYTHLAWLYFNIRFRGGCRAKTGSK